MSIEVLTHVWKHSRHKGSELLTLLAIADFARDDGTHAYPSIKSLAKKTRMTERNVQLVLKKLEDSKELSIQRNAGPHGCHRFRINLTEVKSFQGEKFSGVKSFQGEEISSQGKSVTKQEVENGEGEKFSGVKSFQGEEISGVKNLPETDANFSPNPSLDPSEILNPETPPPIVPQADMTPAKRKRALRPFPPEPKAQEQLKVSMLDANFTAWLQKHFPLADVEAQWDFFKAACLAKDYRYADFRHAFMNSFDWSNSPAQRKRTNGPNMYDPANWNLEEMDRHDD